MSDLGPGPGLWPGAEVGSGAGAGAGAHRAGEDEADGAGWLGLVELELRMGLCSRAGEAGTPAPSNPSSSSKQPRRSADSSTSQFIQPCATQPKPPSPARLQLDPGPRSGPGPGPVSELRSLAALTGIYTAEICNLLLPLNEMEMVKLI